MAAFSILLGGDIAPTKRLMQQVFATRAIAADSGMRHAEVLGLKPELWVGDFDSRDESLEVKYANVPRQKFATDKDATDGELAISAAVKRGATSLALVGALGGQFDHQMAHAMMLLKISKTGLACWLTNGHEEVYPLQNCTLKGHAPGTRLSIIPTTTVISLSISGVRFPLKNRGLNPGATLTLSNEIITEAAITLVSGEGLIVVYPKETNEKRVFND